MFAALLLEYYVDLCKHEGNKCLAMNDISNYYTGDESVCKEHQSVMSVT